jgi:FtsH ternary system domain X3-analog
MAEMTIQLRCDPETGKRDIIVQLGSDADSTPQEHEQLHRELVDRLVNGGILKAGEAGKLIVEREPEKGASADLPVGEPIPPEKRAAAEGH